MTKRQTTVQETKNRATRAHENTGVNSGAMEGQAVPAPLYLFFIYVFV